MRFNYLYMPYDSQDNDYYADDPIVLLSRRELPRLGPDGIEPPECAQALFPLSIASRVAGADRGRRIARIGADHSQLLLPIELSYCIYEQIEQSALESHTLPTFTIAAHPAHSRDVGLPAQPKKQKHRIEAIRLQGGDDPLIGHVLEIVNSHQEIDRPNSGCATTCSQQRQGWAAIDLAG